MKSLNQTLISINACQNAIKWAGGKTPEEAYTNCPRGDWLLWLATKLKIDRKLIVLASCDCAESVLEFVPAGEDRPKQAIEVARRWCEGNASIEEVRIARIAAYATDAVYAVDAAAAAYAAYAAAAAAAYAVYAADAADAAASAAYVAAAYAAAARTQKRKECADIVRKYISFDTFLKHMDKTTCLK